MSLAAVLALWSLSLQQQVFAMQGNEAAKYANELVSLLGAAVTSSAGGSSGSTTAASVGGASLVPIDLSVNHLQTIPMANGVLAQTQPGAADEDFLPIVDFGAAAGGGGGAGSVAGLPEFRFRLRPSVGATPAAMKDISAYRIVAQQAHGSDGSGGSSSSILWDSGKVLVVEDEGMPRSIPWGGDPLAVGTIVKWKVSIWDAHGLGPVTSEDSKFAVGPSAHQEWVAKWIVHPHDIAQFTSIVRFAKNIEPEQCEEWKRRRPLPVVRGKVELTPDEAASKKVVSALLLVSGLGAFATTWNGVPLSSSSVLDPPMLDYTQRVSYRGYDVTQHLQSASSHVIGITLGSSWWDPRPFSTGMVKYYINPRGPLTAIAELHVTFDDGTTVVKSPTGSDDGINWQVAKGFLRDSDIFTGDTIDLGRTKAMQGWDTPQGWSDVSQSAWVTPALYKSDITTAIWREAISEEAGVKPRVNGPKKFAIAPVGKLSPNEAPPVMPIERIAPESVVSLGDGRWLFDFGRAMSGVLRFENGLPNPIVPINGYPRAHSIETIGDEAFITVVYGDSVQMETGDINLVIVAGLGLHDGGPRGISKQDKNTSKAGGPCYPIDHGGILAQRDVFVLPKANSGSFSDARQAMFTSHGFRFAEVCCTQDPPQNVYAVAYRTAFQEWGRFDSSNVLVNGAYELSKNALNSNMLGTQTDCPHRERLQYGGDMVAAGYTAMHFFDLSAFYTKIIHDWTDTQWENGAYGQTSIWNNLGPHTGIVPGAGETVWASLPPVLTARHIQHYGDLKFAEETFDHHMEWFDCLKNNWAAGMHKLYGNEWGDDVRQYPPHQNGFGDWLSVLTRDTWLTHNSFYMASARAIAYLAERLKGNEGKADQGKMALALADKARDDINAVYMENDFHRKKGFDWTPGPDLGLFARMVPGPQRCNILESWIAVAGSAKPPMGWSGDEEQLFLRHLNQKDLDEMINLGQVVRQGKNQNGQDRFRIVWKRGFHMGEGILAVRYTLFSLSDSGFHSVALNKVTGQGYPSYEYMLSHNATTVWESFWRSEDLYSRNHPMLGAAAEWMVAAVAGIALAPKTLGGREILFWPRIPTSAHLVQYASAIQGTKRGDASIAWELRDSTTGALSSSNSSIAMVHLRLLVPPGSTATLRLPSDHGGERWIKHAERMPDFEKSKAAAAKKCAERRKAGMGFSYNWEYDRLKKEWTKFHNGKAIGTPCRSYLFGFGVDEIQWSASQALDVINSGHGKTETAIEPGLYEVMIDEWKLMKKIEDSQGYQGYQGHDPSCSDPDNLAWDVLDATHLI